jgi:hypothetical protein
MKNIAFPCRLRLLLELGRYHADNLIIRGNLLPGI